MCFQETLLPIWLNLTMSILVENGDTVRSSGWFTYGMQKIGGEWKAVTAHVSHIPKRSAEEKGWSKFSPSAR